MSSATDALGRAAGGAHSHTIGESLGRIVRIVTSWRILCPDAGFRLTKKGGLECGHPRWHSYSPWPLGLAVFVQPAAGQADAPDMISGRRDGSWLHRHGRHTLRNPPGIPVRLSDFRGEVVVLAFFFRARTRG